jgi:hypothetical protein
LGIDAPEKGQAFGERSKQNLTGLLHGKRVEGRCPKRDRYGRRRPCAVRAPTLSRPPPGVLMLFSGAKTKMSIFIRQLLHPVL